MGGALALRQSIGRSHRVKMLVSAGYRLHILLRLLFYQVCNKITCCYQFTIYVSVFVGSFLNFYGEAQVHAIRMCVVAVGQANLKTKVLHVTVSGVHRLLFCIYVFEHVLKNVVESAWYVSCDINVIVICFYELSNFSYLIANFPVVWHSSINSGWGTNAIERRNGFAELKFSSYVSLHLCSLSGQKILSFFFAVVSVVVAVGAAFLICCFVLWFLFLLLFLLQGEYMRVFFQAHCYCQFLLHKQSFYIFLAL